MAGATAILEYSSSKPTPAILCPNCGSYCPVAAGAASALGDENQRRIAELEAQVSLLKKAAADATAAAERSSLSQSPPRPSTAPGDRPNPPVPPATPATSSAARFGALLHLGGSSATTSPPPQTATPSSTILRKLSGSSPSAAPQHQSTLSTASTSSSSAAELAARLAREQDLRQRAEGQAAQMTSELEELSASLFAQANEMVAAERRARAKLEERVVILERRDGEKRVRLERLEKALRRIERVKGVLGEA